MNTNNNLTRGVLTFAYGYEYQRMAYAQALTLADLDTPLTVVVPYLEYPKLAEVAVVIEFKEPMAKFEWEAYAYDLSPYDVTIKTDCDVIFPLGFDIQHYFDQVEKIGLVSGQSCDLESEAVDCSWYRKKELELGWPSFYVAIYGFTKDRSLSFFEYAKNLFIIWWKLKPILGSLPPTTDSVFSLAYRDIVGTNQIENGLNFIHAKQGVCGDMFLDNWSASVPHHISQEGTLYVNGHKVFLPFHYVDKDFLSKTIMSGIRNVLR